MLRRLIWKIGFKYLATADGLFYWTCGRYSDEMAWNGNNVYILKIDVLASNVI